MPDEVKISELPTFGSLPDDDDYLVIVNDDTTKRVTRQNFLGITGTVVGTDDTQTLTNKTITSPLGIVKADVGLGNVDNTSDATKNAASVTLTNKTISTGSTIDANVTVTEVLKKVYPIGSIYIATVSTNPNTLFGFGTWSAFGAGKTLIGIDSGDTDFDTVEETGGSKTSAHSHNLSNAGWAMLDLNSTTSWVRLVSNITSWTATNDQTGVTWAGDTTAKTRGVELDGATDSASPSIVQPYIVTYMWKRTA